ncbi:MAG: hypothetical protein H7Z70_06960, partial [Bacteroidia bacterium]|nr:hypothetical protein [Methylotenera sp.]
MSKSDYEIGYGKPPKESRFAKGRSGNPKGRPRGRKNIFTVLRDALNEKVIITVNGVRKKITKQEAAVMQQVNKAAGGDNSSFKLLAPLFSMIETYMDDNKKPVSQEAELEILNQLQLRVRNVKIKHKHPKNTEE